MKKIETLFTGVGLFVVIITVGGLLWQLQSNIAPKTVEYPANKYGAFLAAQHAVYVNDFETASNYIGQIPDSKLKIVREFSVLTQFLNGQMPEKQIESLKNESGMAEQLIYDAYLVQKKDWKSVYNRHKSDDSVLVAPLRIWSGVATGNIKDTLKFIKKLKTNESWRAFARGAVYANTGDIKQATVEFARVQTSFININDYLYLMAFYNHNNLTENANKLRTDFTSGAAGMFMLDVKISPKWENYAGPSNQLAFSLIQTVSHTQIMMYSDVSLLMLRFAEIIGDNDDDILRYYIGQYFFNNGGNYQKYFYKIDKNHPVYPFAQMKIAEKTNDLRALKSAVQANPLFIPAATKLIALYVQNGNQAEALGIVNKALNNKNLTESGRVFFLKARANIFITFGDLDRAQKDIQESSIINPTDLDVMAKQSRIWVMQNRELDTAYDYALVLVRKNPINIEYWDLLAMVVWQKEGPTAALDVLERVGEVAANYSALFEHLGDLYKQTGNNKLARESYGRAIDLSSDGLTVIPKLEQKLRSLK